jgi:hypothetical protein
MEPHSTRWLGAAALLAAVVQIAACKSETTALPALGAELGATSVSGLSAGAYMAGQFQIAHSSIVRGAGIIAGGPYGCAESAFADVMPGPGAPFLNLSKAMNGCMLDAMQAWGIPNPELLAERARKLADLGRIDATDGLAATRVYLFSGTNDRIVLPSIVAAAAKLYTALGVPDAQVKLVSDIGAGHAFVTEDKGLACGRTGEPYITDCDYDQAGVLLAHIYGQLNPRTAQPTGEFIVFDQREFLRDLAPRPRRGGRRLRAARLPDKPGLPRAHRLPRLQSAACQGRRRFHQGYGLRQLGGWQPPDRAVSAGDDGHAQPAGLLGLVGLYGPRIPYPQGAAGGGRAPHAGSPGGALISPPAGGTASPAAGLPLPRDATVLRFTGRPSARASRNQSARKSSSTRMRGKTCLALG